MIKERMLNLYLLCLPFNKMLQAYSGLSPSSGTPPSPSNDGGLWRTRPSHTGFKRGTSIHPTKVPPPLVPQTNTVSNMTMSRPSAKSGRPLAPCPRYKISMSRPNNVSRVEECLNGPRDVKFNLTQVAALSFFVRGLISWVGVW